MSTYARRHWARLLIEKAGGVELPRYGSVEWLRLPEGDPVRIAAVVVAAEAYARQGDELEDDLRREVDALQHAYKDGQDEGRLDRIEAHREEWGRVVQLPPGIWAERNAARRARLEGGDAS